MPNTTYVPIAEYTLASTASNYTFTSIPSTYTDLVVTVNGKIESGLGTIFVQYNGDTAGNYHYTRIYGGDSDDVVRTDSDNGQAQAAFGLIGATARTTSILQVNNYTQTSSGKTGLGRSFVQDYNNYMSGHINYWTGTTAINSIKLLVTSSSFSIGTTFALYGITSAAVAGSNKATGGTITVRSGYTYHTFTSGGTFTPNQDVTADILLVAGGGGGGTYSGGGGGGGAGGVLLLANQSLTNGTGYTVSVGGGGAANTNGQNSYFGALTQAVGGGKGGSASAGGNGGSGGGASDTGYAAGTGTAGQGYSGGIGTGAGSSPGGGGGGSAEPGQDAYGDNVPNIAGKGGSGTNFYYDWAAATSTGVSGYFAGGGGGGVYINSSFANNGGGAGGNGGGGSGSASNKNATTNSGSGGGGGSYTSGPVSPGNGGSGIVIVRYAN